MPEPTVLLLSTSDTDLISARSSGKNYRWANPSRLSDLELTDLLAEASIVVIRILGGYRAWQSGIDTVIAGGVPAVLVSGEQAADAELTDRSTVAAGTALQAHIYLAHGGVDNLRELHAFLCDTVLMTGFGFTPPVATPTWGVLEHPDAGKTGPTIAVLYVEFDTAAMPNLAAYGIAVPTMVLITSTLRHRDRIPVAVLALVGVFSLHITGGIVVALLVSAWWLFEALRHPVRSRLADLLTLAGVAAMAGLVMLPQFLSVRQQEDIIAGHAFPTYLSKKRGLFDAVFQHSRHLNDFPVQYALIVLAAIGGLILLVKKIWWPLAVWLLLIVMNVDAGTPLGGPIGGVAGALGEFFYHDPRRIAAATTLLLMLMAGVALFATVMLLVAAAKRLTDRFRPQPVSVWASATATLLIGATLVSAWHYFPRHRFLFGDKYDSVMIDQKDLDAMAYLASLPGARDTLIGNANTDGTAWMYAVAGLHPLWTHYDYPLQQGPGYHRFIFWAYGRNGESDPRVLEAIQVLRIRYILTSTPTVRGFAVPDGLVSLETSRSWAKIYDNGEARIYEWRGTAAATHS